MLALWGKGWIQAVHKTVKNETFSGEGEFYLEGIVSSIIGLAEKVPLNAASA